MDIYANGTPLMRDVSRDLVLASFTTEDHERWKHVKKVVTNMYHYVTTCFDEFSEYDKIGVGDLFYGTEFTTADKEFRDIMWHPKSTAQNFVAGGIFSRLYASSQRNSLKPMEYNPDLDIFFTYTTAADRCLLHYKTHPKLAKKISTTQVKLAEPLKLSLEKPSADDFSGQRPAAHTTINIDVSFIVGQNFCGFLPDRLVKKFDLAHTQVYWEPILGSMSIDPLAWYAIHHRILLPSPGVTEVDQYRLDKFVTQGYNFDPQNFKGITIKQNNPQGEY